MKIEIILWRISALLSAFGLLWYATKEKDFLCLVACGFVLIGSVIAFTIKEQPNEK